MVDVTDATFETEVLALSEKVPVVVDLWAPWCGPCRTLGPILETVIGETDGKVVLAKVNTDENPQVSEMFQVQGIPAVYAVKDRQVVSGFVGAQPEGTVRQFVSTLLPSEDEAHVADLLAIGDEPSLVEVLAISFWPGSSCAAAASPAAGCRCGSGAPGRSRCRGSGRPRRCPVPNAPVAQSQLNLAH